MNINNVPGQYAFKGLLKRKEGWQLTPLYFLSLEDFKKTYPDEIYFFWPVEAFDNGVAYIPHPTELQ